MPRKSKLFGRRLVRRRRTPEVARVELLDAAERTFHELPPDQVGLKDIAREAGVSHALITHYFGTYNGLVEATLERRIRALREVIFTRLREAGALSQPGELLEILFQTLEDPVHLRLMKWLISRDQAGATQAFALQERGIQLVAREVAEALRPQPSRETIETIELALVTAVAAAFGYAVSKAALAGAIGRGVSAELDAGVRRTLAGMLQSYLRDTIGVMQA